MPNLIQAARFYGRGDIRIESIPEPLLKEGHIRIRPAFVGICGTDLHEYIGGPTFCPVKPHPLTKESLPITLGHEFSGTVTAIGQSVSGFTIGQHVVVQPTIYDGTCTSCKSGRINLCYSGGFIGLSGWGGGLSESVVVPENYVLSLPLSIPLDVGALIEPLAVGWHAVNQAPLEATSSVLILGGGPIGIAVLQCLRARGCGTVIVSEVSKKRKEYSKQFGADWVVDPTQEDVVSFVRSKTGGDGVALAFDCAGVSESLKSSCQAIRVGGSVINVAIWEKSVPFQPNDLVFREGHYTASLGYIQQDFKEVISAIESGSIHPEKMITRKVRLANLIEDGFEALIKHKDEYVKILVEM